MTPDESTTEKPEVTVKDAQKKGPAPDSDTQSSAASEAGGRTTEEGSRAPNEPAEGARE